MNINDIDWEAVPDIITKEQVRCICHMSKSTAMYFLKSGKLHCTYSGKKTRCYKIRKEDLMAFIEECEKHPEFYIVPEGWYSGGRKTQRHSSPLLKIDEDLHEYYQYLLNDYPDVLDTKQISEITGYIYGVVNRWCRKGHLKHFSIGTKYRVPKEYLIDFFCSMPFRRISRKSQWHIDALMNYHRWKYYTTKDS